MDKSNNLYKISNYGALQEKISNSDLAFLVDFNDGDIAKNQILILDIANMQSKAKILQCLVKNTQKINCQFNTLITVKKDTTHFTYLPKSKIIITGTSIRFEINAYDLRGNIKWTKHAETDQLYSSMGATPCTNDVIVTTTTPKEVNIYKAANGDRLNQLYYTKKAKFPSAVGSDSSNNIYIGFNNSAISKWEYNCNCV